jgi:hypothetical protein
MLTQTSFKTINIYSISGQNWSSVLLWHYLLNGGVNQMWILKPSKDMLGYIQSRYLSSCNIKRISPTVFHKKKNG